MVIVFMIGRSRSNNEFVAAPLSLQVFVLLLHNEAAGIFGRLAWQVGIDVSGRFSKLVEHSVNLVESE